MAEDLNHPGDDPVASSTQIQDPRAYPDKSQDWLRHFDSQMRVWAVSHLAKHPQIVEEYRRNPFSAKGRQSIELELLLNYFRTHPSLGRLSVYASEPWKEYRVCKLWQRGVKPEFIGDDCFASEEDAAFGLFQERIRILKNEGGVV